MNKLSLFFIFPIISIWTKRRLFMGINFLAYCFLCTGISGLWYVPHIFVYIFSFPSWFLTILCACLRLCGRGRGEGLVLLLCKYFDCTLILLPIKYLQCQHTVVHLVLGPWEAQIHHSPTVVEKEKYKRGQLSFFLFCKNRNQFLWFMINAICIGSTYFS